MFTISVRLIQTNDPITNEVTRGLLIYFMRVLLFITKVCIKRVVPGMYLEKKKKWIGNLRDGW